MAEKKKILVVDDDADLRRGLKMLLGAEFEVQEAPDGEAALGLVSGFRPHLLLLDISMPGIEVLKLVRAKSRAMPVLILTAQTDLELARQALDIGATAYITKPFEFGELRAEVERLLREPSPDDPPDDGRPWRVAGS